MPQQLWLLGCCVVTHRALELLPCKEVEDKVSITRLAGLCVNEGQAWSRYTQCPLPGGRPESQVWTRGKCTDVTQHTRSLTGRTGKELATAEEQPDPPGMPRAHVNTQQAPKERGGCALPPGERAKRYTQERHSSQENGRAGSSSGTQGVRSAGSQKLRLGLGARMSRA